MKKWEKTREHVEFRITEKIEFREKRTILAAARLGEPGCVGRVKTLLESGETLVVVYRGAQPVALRMTSASAAPDSEVSQKLLIFARLSQRRSLRVQLSAALALCHVAVSEQASAMPPLTIPLTHSVSEVDSERVADAPDCSEASSSCSLREVDRLFPGAGHVGLTFSSGIPHALLGEVNVGVSPWFSLAAGATVSDKFNETSVFMRPRFAVAKGSWFDVAMHLPLVYYPAAKVRHDYDWVLTNPAFFFRAHASERTSVYLGAGLVFASTTGSMAAAFRDPEPMQAPEDWDFSNVDQTATETTVNGVWNTFHGGIDVKLGGGWISQLDLILLMEGVRISGRYADKIGPPVFAQAGFTYVF